MTITVTDAMVAAAKRQIPGAGPDARIRKALEAAVAAAPSVEQVLDVPVTALVHLEVDEQQLHAAVDAAVLQLRENIGANPDGRLRLATLDENAVLGSPQPTMTVNEPQLDPALGRPLELGGITEVAARLDVARSTVNGWVKNAETNGMPAPLQQLAAGPVWDLRELAVWHAQWKGTSDGEPAA